MTEYTHGENVLDGLRIPVIERLIRNAPPARQRAFAIACARLAGSIAELHWNEKLLPLMKQTFAAAHLLAEGADPQDPRVVAARVPIHTLARESHAIYHVMQDRFMEDTEEGRYTTENHPEGPAISEAMRHYVALEAAETALHESPFEAAALNLEALSNALRIDYDTILALARHWLLPHPEPIERDPVWPLFKPFPDE